LTKQIEELERLNELRQRGALSEGEYAEAKAKILAATTQAKRRGGLSPWVGRGAGAVGLALAIFVIKPLIRPHHADGPPPNAASTSGDGWEVTEKHDPMTDATIKTATRTFEGEQANITLAVSCDSVGAVRYEATSFDKDGKPAEMLQKPSYAGFYVPYDLRVGSNPPVGDSNINPRFSNQISFEPKTFSDSYVQGSAVDFEARDPARASKLTFGFHLAHGDETIVIDQAGSAAATVLAPCVLARHARLIDAVQKERSFEERRAADAATAAAQATTEQQAQQQAAEAQRVQEQQAAKQRARDDQLTEQRRLRSNQAANCEQIRRSGTTDPAYLRMEGCL
jgi:hypothetical protein